VAKTQHGGGSPPNPDLLAAVALHTLVTQAGAGIAIAGVAAACERDLDDEAERREIETALQILLADGLATREGDLYRPTRAAVRASELSF
jgi:hypothetical protein